MWQGRLVCKKMPRSIRKWKIMEYQYRQRCVFRYLYMLGEMWRVSKIIAEQQFRDLWNLCVGLSAWKKE